MLYSGFDILPRSVFWSADLNGRSDNTDVIHSSSSRQRNEITMAKHEIPEWVTRGKTIRQLIAELQTFENQDVEVRISVNYGNTDRCVSIVEQRGDYCVLVNSEDYHNNEWQTFMDEQDCNES